MSYSRIRAEDTSRRVIDVAIGVLVGLRGCSQREAFDELVRVLVALASGAASAGHAEAFTAWGELISRDRPVPAAVTG